MMQLLLRIKTRLPPPKSLKFVLNAQTAEEEEKSEAFWNTGSPYASGEGFLPTKMEVSDDAQQNMPKTKEAEA